MFLRVCLSKAMQLMSLCDLANMRSVSEWKIWLIGDGIMKNLTWIRNGQQSEWWTGTVVVLTPTKRCLNNLCRNTMWTPAYSKRRTRLSIMMFSTKLATNWRNKLSLVLEDQVAVWLSRLTFQFTSKSTRQGRPNASLKASNSLMCIWIRQVHLAIMTLRTNLLRLLANKNRF